METTDGLNQTALFSACCFGKPKCVKLLLARKANADKLCVGWTPLLTAVYHNHPECVKLLVDYGADLSLRMKSDIFGLWTVMEFACNWRRDALLPLLVPRAPLAPWPE